MGLEKRALLGVCILDECRITCMRGRVVAYETAVIEFGLWEEFLGRGERETLCTLDFLCYKSNYYHSFVKYSFPFGMYRTRA